MSADKFARLRELQRELVEELQREYFCEDVAVPTNAFGWSKDKIQAFFESGGAELSEQTMSDTTPVIRPSVANIVTEDVAMPCIVLVGDSITHFGSKVPGSAAMKMIVKDAFDFPPCPPIKDGPGWVTLLARDYMHTRRAEVLNRGVCGFTTRLMLDDLTAGVMSLPKPDASGSRVLAVTLMLGSNDHSSPRDIFHVPIEEYEANLSAILALLAKRYPASVLLLLTLPPCIEATVRTWFVAATKNMMDGGQRGEARLGPYVEAARRVAKKMNGAGTDVRLVDVYEQMHAHCHKHSMTMDELFYDGLHLSGEGNNVLYRIVAKALIACGLQPTALPRQRPSATHTLMMKANPQWAPDAEDRMPESMP